MKICIPCASNTAQAQVLEGNIGSAPYFAVYESNNGNYKNS
jgi:predicted Fe-Mo cluster-binding NifX family protein